MVCGSRVFELRAQSLRVAQSAGQARRSRSQVRRDPGADRRSGGNARRSEAQVRPQVLPGLCAGDANGALFYTDAIQAVRMFPIDVRAAGVDFLCSGTYKWLLGSFGVAPFFIRRELL